MSGNTDKKESVNTRQRKVTPVFTIDEVPSEDVEPAESNARALLTNYTALNMDSKRFRRQAKQLR